MVQNIFRDKKFYDFYFYFVSAFIVLLLIVVPFFIKRSYVGSFVFDILIRFLITFTLVRSIYSSTHIEDGIKNFYKGTKELKFKKPNTVSQILNIFVGIAMGIGYSVILFFTLTFFGIIFESILIVIISIYFGVLITIPLIMKHKGMIIYSWNPFE